jgi:hypothetical protein
MKKFKQLKAGESVFCYWDGCQAVLERKVQKVIETEEGIMIKVLEIGILGAPFDPEATRVNNYFTTKEEAQQTMNQKVQKEIDGLHRRKKSIDRKIAELEKQII